MITYTDKVQLIVNPNPDVNKWTAANANEVKNEVNGNITATATAQSTANTAVSDAATALAVANTKQASDADLTAIAAIVPANDDLIQRKAGVWTNRTLAQIATDLGLDAGTIVSITGAISLTSSAFGKIHICTGTSSNYTIDLPTAVGNTGKSIILKGSGLLTKDITVQGVSGQLIDDEALRKFSTEGSFTLMSDGTNWMMVNEVGSWVAYTPTFAGFSVDPTIGRADYFRVGKLCTARIILAGSGTSNATNFTVTVPFNSAEVARSASTVISNNGTVQAAAGLAQTRLNSSTVDMYRDATFGTWGGASTKRADLLITYRIQ